MRRSAGIYIFLLVILAGVYYYINNRPPKADDESTLSTPVPVEYLFSFDDGLPAGIRIESKAGEVVEVVRDAENAWALTLPVEASADQSVVEAAASQITTIRILDHIPNLAVDAVGLDNPEYTFTVRFTSSVERIVKIGVLTPTGNGYYASLDGGEIIITSITGMDALIGFLFNPPYLATETPPPSPLEADPPLGETAAPQP